MTERLVFLGGTAFGEIVEIVRDINAIERRFEVTAILDDNPELHGQEIGGYPVLGPLEMARDMDDVQFVYAIGSYRTRLDRHTILDRLGIPPERFPALVHPSAKVYPTATIGHGAILYPGAVVFTGTVIEDFVIILVNSVIGVRNRICRAALITSLVSTTRDVTVGSCAHVGSGSAIGEGVKIGPGAQVGMGSVVLRDIPPGAFVLGNPPRYLDKVDVPDAILDDWATLSEKEGEG